MAQTMLPVGYDPALDIDTQRFLIARMAALTGLADPRSIAVFWDDFEGSVIGNAISPDWRQPAPVGTGAASFAVAGGAGGIIQLTTGATANSVISQVTDSPFIFTVTTAPWYVCHRSKITTAVDAATIVYSGLQNAAANKTLGSGVFGASSTVNFVAQFDGNETGTFTDLGVAIDTAYHVFEQWGTIDGRVHCAIDFGVDKGNLAQVSAPADYCYAIRMAKNGATAAARTVQTDYVMMVGQRI